MLMDKINVVELFHVKSSSLVRCKEGDVPLLNFSNLTCMRQVRTKCTEHDLGLQLHVSMSLFSSFPLMKCLALCNYFQTSEFCQFPAHSACSINFLQRHHVDLEHLTRFLIFQGSLWLVKLPDSLLFYKLFAMNNINAHCSPYTG